MRSGQSAPCRSAHCLTAAQAGTGACLMVPFYRRPHRVRRFGSAALAPPDSARGRRRIGCRPESGAGQHPPVPEGRLDEQLQAVLLKQPPRDGHSLQVGGQGGWTYVSSRTVRRCHVAYTGRYLNPAVSARAWLHGRAAGDAPQEDDGGYDWGPPSSCHGSCWAPASWHGCQR